MAADHLAQMPDVLRPRFRGYCGASADYVLVSSSAEEVFDESADGIYVRCGHGRAASAEDFRCRESYCSAYASSVYAVAAGRQSEVYDAGRSVPGDYYIVRRSTAFRCSLVGDDVRKSLIFVPSMYSMTIAGPSGVFSSKPMVTTMHGW